MNIYRTLIIITLCILPSFAFAANKEELFKVIETQQSLNEISRGIWEDMLGQTYTQQIDEFKNKHPIPFQQFKAGATWISLKEKLDVGMTTPIHGTAYSWQEFREIDKAFKEKLVNSALAAFTLDPVRWGVTGTVGYNSDIDNVAQGQSAFQETMAKILMDTLHVYMYQNTSDIAFDEEVYTQHPGATLQTMRHIENPEAMEKYKKTALSLGQLQIFRNIHNSRVLPWEKYKNEFLVIFPEAKSLIKSIEEFEDELHKAEQQDEQTLKIKYGVDPKDLNALVDLKSLAALSQQILSQDKNAEALQQSISKEKLNFSDPLANKDMQIIIQAATKEKDDLLIHSALLFALRGTYFPESYFTQEAFQLIVTGDQPISQVLSLMVNDYLRKGNPDKFQNINELRKHLIETHKDLFTKANTFTHLISLGEQLGYFIHKIETPEPLDSKTFMKGGKYLHRFAFSFEATMRDLQQDSPFTHRLNAVANVLSTYQRGKIFIQPERIESDLQAFITKASPDLDPAEIKKIAASCTQYVLQKLFQELTSPQQQKEACLEIFKDHPHLKKALDAKESSDGIITSDEKMTLLLNALIGKARHENEAIRRHFDHEFREACSALKLTTESEIQAFLEQMVTAYVMAIKMFYQKPENKFDPYSLNYNEISLMHTFDPADIIPEE